MEVKRLVCKVSVFMSHLAAHSVKFYWREEFPIKVAVAKLSIASVLANELGVNIRQSFVAFSIFAKSPHDSEPRFCLLPDNELITQDMLLSLRVDLSFPEGNLYYRAGKLRAFLVELSKCDVKDNLLMLPEECPVFKFGEQSFIAIRDCYLRLFDRIANRVPLLRVALSGTEKLHFYYISSSSSSFVGL
jgi:hypothetical protein